MVYFRSQLANCDFEDSKTKKMEYLKTEGHLSKLDFGESKHKKRYENYQHNGNNQLKRSSWALSDRNQSSQHFNKVDMTEKNDHVSDTSSLTWPKSIC